jgi:spermidine/putrescine transport system ATP-binding protein
MVFQSLALFDHRTVGQNIEFAMKMKGVAPAARRARALELMALVRLPESYHARPVTRCSGGERQRVALARALASDPESLFFDEPLSALEVELKDLHRRTGKTFVYITHSLEEAMVLSDRIAIMQAGRFVQIGTPREIYGAPINRFVAAFMGEVNILPVNGGAFTTLGRPAPSARAAYAVLRPEALRLGTQGDVLVEAEVRQRMMLGSRTQVHLLAGSQPLIAEIASLAAEALSPGDRAAFAFDMSDLAWVTE